MQKSSLKFSPLDFLQKPKCDNAPFAVLGAGFPKTPPRMAAKALIQEAYYKNTPIIYWGIEIFTSLQPNAARVFPAAAIL